MLVALAVAFFFYCCILRIRNGGHGGHDRERRIFRCRRVDDTTINHPPLFFLAYLLCTRAARI